LATELELVSHEGTTPLGTPVRDDGTRNDEEVEAGNLQSPRQLNILATQPSLVPAPNLPECASRHAEVAASSEGQEPTSPGGRLVDLAPANRDGFPPFCKRDIDAS